MKRIEIHQVLFKCEICNSPYLTEDEASKCEGRIIEKKTLSVGDKVQSVEPRKCDIKNKRYFFVGEIIKIIGPFPSDYEYEMKWLGSRCDKINGHVFTYRVEFRCPYCGLLRTHDYYDPELKLIR
jgi:hypothetical protein